MRRHGRRSWTPFEGAELYIVDRLLGALAPLVVNDRDRAEARKAILEALSDARPDTPHLLVGALRSFSPIESWLGWLAS